MRAWLSYAGAGLVLALVVAGIASLLVGAEARSAVWFAACVAYLVQLAAFGALVAVRTRNELFLVGWLIGMVARFAVVGVVAWALSVNEVVSRSTALVSLVGFLFLLLLMEPLFLRRGLQAK